MGRFDFIKAFASVSLQDAANNLTSLIAAKFPETASKAQLEAMSEEFEELHIVLERYKTQAANAQARADSARAEYNKSLEMGRRLETALAGKLDDKTRKEHLEAQEILAKKVTDMKPSVLAAIEDARLAQEYVGKVQEACDAFWERLRTTKEKLAQAMKNQERSRMDAKLAEQRADDAATVMGLKLPDTSSVDIATQAIEADTQKNREIAAAANARAKLMETENTPTGGNAVLQKLEAEMNEPTAASSGKSPSEILASEKPL